MTTEDLRGSTLDEVFRDTVARWPDRLALVDGNHTCTYAELDTWSRSIAGQLREHGVREGERVGLAVGRHSAAVAGILAVLRVGGAYVPLDPAYPAERLRGMVTDAGLRLVVGRPGERPLPSDVRWVGPEHPDSAPVILADAAPDPDRPAYVIYTSGSTGQPKGCLVSHANVVALLKAAVPLFEVDEHDRWTLFHSTSFDFSVWEMWGALATGGTLVVVDDATARSPQDFARLLEMERISVLNLVPSVFRSMVRTPGGLPTAPSVRHLVFGGESVELDVVADFLKACGSRRPRVTNMYGLTETTVHATAKVIDAEDLGGAVRSPIGVALPHLRIEIRDAEGLPVGPGEAGEMWIAGAGVALGYLDRPELTAQRFVERDGERFYRTGDLARHLDSGELEYLGRDDGQVKIRGFRIELGELEACFRRHPAVGGACALTLTRTDGAAVLVVCVTLSTPAEVDELRAHAAAELAPHMLPAHVLVADTIVLTPSGKTDRTAMAGWAQDCLTRPAVAAPSAAPPLEDDIPGVIARIWAEVLGTHDFDTDETFFDVGGDSLSLVAVHHRLTAAFPQADVTIVQLFEYPTIDSLAAFLASSVGAR